MTSHFPVPASDSSSPDEFIFSIHDKACVYVKERERVHALYTGLGHATVPPQQVQGTCARRCGLELCSGCGSSFTAQDAKENYTCLLHEVGQG